jgi:hypothetical protein
VVLLALVVRVVAVARQVLEVHTETMTLRAMALRVEEVEEEEMEGMVVAGVAVLRSGSFVRLMVFL